MSSNKYIEIKGARVNNLKNISIKIPRNKLVLITGVSGSGKSSLAFDTLYAEGQRRYVESLGSYARQFLQRMEKPDVDYIYGLAPALAIEQRRATGNPRSTVGTITETYDYLKLLFARLGKTFSPVSGEEVKQDSVGSITDRILQHPDGTKVMILAKMPVRSLGFEKELEINLQKGFSRIWLNDEPMEIEELLESGDLPNLKEFYLLIDRLALRAPYEDTLRFRLSDSIQTAYQEGFSECYIQIGDLPLQHFSEKFERDGISFELPSVNLFSFNNPYGACKRCEGFGRVMGIDEQLVVPNPSLSLEDEAVAPWRGKTMSAHLQNFLTEARKHNFPVDKPWIELSEEQKEFVRNGIGNAEGYLQFFDFIASKSHKIQYRVMLSRYRGYTTCPECKGSRLRKDATYVKINGYNITDFLFMELKGLLPIISSLQFNAREEQIAARVLREIKNRLQFLNDVGLGYLTLHRKINTLSGGEMQRIKLATSLGGGLVGSMYVLDEPSIGLHPRDTDKLITILEALRDKGNSVIVVEHEESIIRKSDEIIDIGPRAGELGGEVVFQGGLKKLLGSKTLTANYLSGKSEIPVPKQRRKSLNVLRLIGAAAHNLKHIEVNFPLNTLTVVTGVSGSGKTSLIKQLFYPAVKQALGKYGDQPGPFKSLEGEIGLVSDIEMIDQSPIGRSARSNPATYVKVYDHIRELYASQPLAKMKGMKPGSFSFNVEGGRCEDCKGEGWVTIEMQFLPDVKLKCEACDGKRFKPETLEVQYEGKNIDDVLNMTIAEALDFFKEHAKITSRLEILNKVGLGYLRIGQSSSTLSGGEAQRIKLAHFLIQGKESKGKIFLFDEPTTGLHFDDIHKLLYAINELIDMGNTVIVIEHNLDVIKTADWLIDLGPEGGKNGGELLYEGPPEGLMKVKRSYTGKYLQEKLRFDF